MSPSYQLIISRLRHDIGQDRLFYDKRVAVMIADAKRLRRNPLNRREIDRVMYDFSIALEKNSGEMLDSLNEYKLDRRAYRILLSFFESL